MRDFASLVLLMLGLACGACTQPASPEPPASPDLENGSFTVELDGVSIHYEVHGRGPVLMTLPNSWGLSLEGLRALYRPLEQDLTLVYFDPRGMGGSGPVRGDADMGVAAVRADFEALRRHLGLERVDVIGWSNGAMNLLVLADEHPGSIGRAIFLHGAASWGPEDYETLVREHPEWMAAYEAFLQRASDPALPAEERDAETRRFLIETSLPASFAEPQGARERLERLYSETRFSWAHWRYSQEDVPAFDARDRLGRIRARSLVLAGAHDTLPPAKAVEMHEGLADSRLEVFENSGHFAPIEEPDAFRATVLEFLQDGAKNVDPDA